MIRSVDFPIDARAIKNPTNSPLATPGARQAAAARTRLTIETIGLILSAHFTKPGRYFTTAPTEASTITKGDAEGIMQPVGWTRPNRWTVRLTRISMGTVDPITGGASMKAIQDAVARWCEVANERDPLWRWIEPIGQEKRGYVKQPDGSKRAWTGVRIELEDLAPGEPRRVVLATIAGFEATAKAAIKAREKAKMPRVGKSMDRKATLRRMQGGTQVYHAAEGQQAASSAARGRAEAAFAKATGKAPTPLVHPTYGPVNVEADELVLRAKGTKPRTPKAAPAGSEDATPRMLEPCQVHGVARGIVCPGEPSGACVHRRRLAGLASAAARVLPPTKPTGPRKPAVKVPEDLAAMREQARTVACAACVRDAGFECWDLSNHDRQPSLDFEYGVHVARARAAGLPAYPCAADLDAGARPVALKKSCATCGGEGRDETRDETRDCPACGGEGCTSVWTWLPGRGAEVWLVLPWGPACERCASGGVVCGRGLHAPGQCVEAGCNDEETCQRSEGGCNGAGRKPLYTRARDLEADPPERATFAVPVEHRAAFGQRVVLTREVFTTRANRLAWMFRTEKRG